MYNMAEQQRENKEHMTVHPKSPQAYIQELHYMLRLCALFFTIHHLLQLLVDLVQKLFHLVVILRSATNSGGSADERLLDHLCCRRVGIAHEPECLEVLGDSLFLIPYLLDRLRSVEFGHGTLLAFAFGTDRGLQYREQEGKEG